MKKIGLIGGISWVSTLDYYKFINEGVNQKMGGLHAVECVIYSLNFAELQQKTWANAYPLLLNAGAQLKKTGIDALVLGANTAHLYAMQLEQDLQLPIIHIVTETAKCIQAQGLKTIGLLGTKFTMEMGFYKNKLEEMGLEVLTPALPETRNYIQQMLVEELGRGEIKQTTKEKFMAIAQELIERGAEGLILGCTEIPLLMGQSDFDIPVFDSTKIHCEAVVRYVVEE